ncbi:MAG: hypothetical protein AAGL69_03070 [Pseudomonadota bacterium]
MGHDNMFVSRSQRAVRALTAVLTTLALAGCFGTGDGPEQIAGTPAPPPPPLPPGFCDAINFEDACDPVGIANFAGGATTLVQNPNASGINTSEQVAQMQKFTDQPFGGTTLATPSGIDFSAGEAFTMKVLSPRQVPVLFKFEGLDRERSLDHSGSNTWEQLCFDFSNDTAGNPVTGITVIFDLGVQGDAENDPNNWTFFYDDIEQVESCAGVPQGTTLPVDFEDDAATYNFGADAGFGGGASSVIANPQSNTINTSAQVAQMQKFMGEVFGGSTLSLAENVDFSNGESVRVKVWSQREVPVLFKFEGLDQERSVTHTGGSEWQDLCFDFTGSTSGPASNALTFIFDLGVAGDAMNDPDNWTFLYDDIRQVADCSTGGGGGGSSALPTLDFEGGAGGADFTWNVFENGDNPGLAFIANPDASGINTSATVAEFTARDAGQDFAGTITNDLPTFTLDASNAVVKVMVWKSVISPVGIKFEDASQGSTGDIQVSNTVTNQWEELTFDFTDVIGNPVNTDITGFVVFPDFAPRDQDNIVYIDNITFGDGSGSGGGGGGGGGMSAPVTTDFESGDFTFSDFGGGVGSIQANPDTSGINPSANAARVQKFAGEVFGGTTLALPGDVDFTNGEAYNIKVYATRMVDVLFKLEGLNQERTVTHGGSGWETLCFDFTGATSGNPATDFTFIFDNGTAGDAAGDPDSWTFFVDDIEQTASCGGGGGGAAGVSIDFEADPMTYDFGPDGGFGGGASSVIANPQTTGNDSAQVARMQKFAAEPFGGSTLALDAAIDFAEGTAFTMNVWSTREVPVLFKLEGLDRERTVNHTGGSEWQTLCFDFTGDTTGDPSSAITFIFENGVNGDATNDPDNWTFYFDDITQVSDCGVPAASFPIDFEADPASYDFGPDAGFGGGASTVIANPQTTGNDSAQVARMQKFMAETFGGSTLVLDGNVDFSSGEAFTMNVWSTRSVPVLFKFEGLDRERMLTHTGGSEWQQLCFDFTGDTAGPLSSAISFFFDNGVVGDAGNDPDNWTFYFDDITQVETCPTGGGGGGGGSSSDLPTLDFEGGAGGADFTWNVFENGDNPGVAFIANPDASGINTSATVAQFTVRDAGQDFAGAITNDLPTFTLDASNAVVKVMVWKSVISDVGIKFEDASQGSTGEIKVANTVTNQWEELTFDFTAVIGNPVNTDITGFVVFPDFAPRDQDNIVYIDNITFGDDAGSGGGGSGGGGGGMSAPVTTDFESGDFTFTDFGGGAGTIEANPDTSGINPSAQAARIQKFADQPFGGTTLALPAAVDFANGEAYNIKVYATRAVPVLFKLEGLNQERTVTHGGSGWENLCFDFTGTTSGDPATDFTFIFENGVVGDAAGDPSNWTFFVDDIEQVSACPAASTNLLPVDFEADPMTYVFRDGGGFGGGLADVIANPQSGGINTSAQVGRMQKFAGEVFGGTTFDLGGDFGFPAGTAFTMNVYASRAVPVLFKLEGGPVGEVSVDHGGTGWETLCFDFGQLAGNGTDGITLIFDLGINGAAATDPDNWTFLFDDIALATDCSSGGGGGGGGTPPSPSGLPTLDFENSAGGADFTWTVFENDDNPGVAFIPNPDASGINTSATVAEFTARADGQDFAGAITNDLPTFTLDGSNAIVKVMVWKSVISDVGIKFENATQGSTGEIKVANTVTNQWEELTFDFTGVIGDVNNTDITGFVVFPDFAPRTGQNVIFIDNITFGDGT